MYDSLNHQPIIGVNVAIRNTAQTALLFVAQSDNDGGASFNLDAALYVAVADAPGYIFSAFDTITVAGTGADTIFGYRFDPGAPSSPSLCRVYGYVYDINGLPQSAATVAAFLPSGTVRSGEMVVAPNAVSTVTDSTGYFALDLIPSDSLNPSHTKYEFTISRADGTILRQRVQVPVSSTWRLNW